MITMENEWSVSGALYGAERSEYGAERAENWMSGNGAVCRGHRKRWSVSGARSGGLSGGSRNALSVEDLYLPLMLRSHALEVNRRFANSSVNNWNR